MKSNYNLIIDGEELPNEDLLNYITEYVSREVFIYAVTIYSHHSEHYHLDTVLETVDEYNLKALYDLTDGDATETANGVQEAISIYVDEYFDWYQKHFDQLMSERLYCLRDLKYNKASNTYLYAFKKRKPHEPYYPAF